jgi:hypothetical protein
MESLRKKWLAEGDAIIDRVAISNPEKSSAGRWIAIRCAMVDLIDACGAAGVAEELAGSRKTWGRGWLCR